MADLTQPTQATTAEKSATTGAPSAVETLLREHQPSESERTAHFNADLLEYLTAISVGADPDVLPLHRYLPVEIYFACDFAEVEGLLFLATTYLIEDEGFTKLFQVHSVGPSEISSFRVTFVLRSLGRLTLKEVHGLLEGVKTECENLGKSSPAPEAAKQAAGPSATSTERGKEENPAVPAPAQDLIERQIKLAETQTKLGETQIKVAVATFLLAALAAGTPVYIQWAHLRAEKPTPESPINLYMTSPSGSFSVPNYRTNPDATSVRTQTI